MTSWTLFLWTAKCGVELLLLFTCITRRVKGIWLLPAYSFPTSLGLMLIYEHLPGCYVTAIHWVDLVGILVMCATFVQLSSLMIERRNDYIPLWISFVVLIAGQFLIQKLNDYFPPAVWLNRLNILIWMVPLLIINTICRRFSRSGVFSRTAVHFMTNSILPPHKSVLVPHNHHRR